MNPSSPSDMNSTNNINPSQKDSHSMSKRPHYKVAMGAGRPGRLSEPNLVKPDSTLEWEDIYDPK